MHEIFEEYIPDFTYCLVDNHRFTNQELLDRQDEMSLIMLLNKIQTKADLSEFVHIPNEEINRIVKESPEAVIDIIAMVMQALCTKLNLSSQDTEECVRKVRTRNMGYLWENMEKIDAQASEAALTAAENRARNAENRAQDAENRALNAENRAQNAEAKNARLKALLEAHGIQIPEA